MAKTMLKREVRRLALTRMEEAARTENDFTEVEKMWNKLDANYERKQRYHGFSIPTRTIDWYAGANYDFLDIIYDSPAEMHNLVSDSNISKSIKELRPKPKDVFYLSAAHLYTIQQIAFVKNQTDRNIRKMRTRMLINLREKSHQRLLIKIQKGGIITTSQRKFLEREIADGT